MRGGTRTCRMSLRRLARRCFRSFMVKLPGISLEALSVCTCTGRDEETSKHFGSWPEFPLQVLCCLVRERGEGWQRLTESTGSEAQIT